MTKTPEYYAWQNMRRRCYDVKTINFNKYGGRGISVCDDWHDFINFYNDMGERPKGMSLDRIDNNKGYYKDNCRWTNRTTQSRNQNTRVDNSSGVKGVCFCNRSNKWCCQISVNKRRKHIGYFVNFEDAVKARKDAELKYW